MALFVGTYEGKMDGKGRVAIPAPFRAELAAEKSGAVYIYPSLDFSGAIEACSTDWMEEMKANLKSVPRFSAERRSLAMSIFGRARLVKFEDDGRFILPKDFAQQAGIETQVAFVGIAETFLIWNPEAAAGALDSAAASVLDQQLTVDEGGKE